MVTKPEIIRKKKSYYCFKVNQMKKILSSVFVLIIQTLLTAQTQQVRFNHLAILVKDLKVSRNFYEQVIGLDTIPEPFHDGKHKWYNIGAGTSIHVIEGADSKKEYSKGNHICLSVSSVGAFMQTLLKNKIDFGDYEGKKGTFTTRPDGIKQIWFQDPDGYWIEINDAK